MPSTNNMLYELGLLCEEIGEGANERARIICTGERALRIWGKLCFHHRHPQFMVVSIPIKIVGTSPLRPQWWILRVGYFGGGSSRRQICICFQSFDHPIRSQVYPMPQCALLSGWSSFLDERACIAAFDTWPKLTTVCSWDSSMEHCSYHWQVDRPWAHSIALPTELNGSPKQIRPFPRHGRET